MNPIIKSMKEQAAKDVEELITICMSATGKTRAEVVATVKATTAKEASKFRIMANSIQEFDSSDEASQIRTNVCLTAYMRDYAAGLQE